MNSSNQTLDEWLSILGSTWLHEILYISTLVPLSIASFVLNFISFRVLLKDSFLNSNYFLYFKIFTFNNLIISVLASTTFVYKAYRLFKFTNSYWAMFYGCYIHFPLVFIFYFYISLLEICMIIERINYFIPAFLKNIRISNTSKSCGIFFLISILINLPLYFTFQPYHTDVKSENDSVVGVYFMKYSFTPLVTVMVNTAVLIRDVFTLILKVVLSVITLMLVKRYMTKIKKEKEEFVHKVSFHIWHSKSFALPKAKETYLLLAERNQTYMSLIMCTFSVIKHLFCTTSFVFLFFNNFSIFNINFFLFLFTLSIEGILNIFILYNFNELFRIELKKKIKALRSKLVLNILNKI